MWGRICSTDPLELRWSKGYNCNSSYYHNQIGSNNCSHCCRILPWLYVRGGCTIISCQLRHIGPRKCRFLIPITIVQFMMCVNSWHGCRIRLFADYKHCHHYMQNYNDILCNAWDCVLSSYLFFADCINMCISYYHNNWIGNMNH